MHGRLLLPAFFALALPASIAVPRRAAVVTGISAVAAAWALVSVVQFREPKNPNSYLLSPISDFRAVSGAKLHPNDTQFGLNGNEAAALYRRGVRGYFKLTDKEPRPGLDPHAFVLTLGSIGVPAYDAGRRIWVVDIGGLAEPLAARTAPVPGRPAGHRKQIDDAWYDAALRRHDEQPEGRGGAPRAHVRPAARVAASRRREDERRAVLLEHLAQRRLHDDAHTDRPGRRREAVVQGRLTRPETARPDQPAVAVTAARIASVTAATGCAASTVTRMPRSR